MQKYVIIDDEPIAHKIIEKYCDNLSYLKKISNCYNAFEAMQVLNQNQVDLIFLDINMPQLSGFDFLKTLINPPKIIVTTAYKEFALEGYELDILDYLLKPFSFERFLKAINKAIQLPSNNKAKSTSKNENDSFFIKGDKKMHHVFLESILFVEAYGNYSKIITMSETILSHENISSMESILPAGDFLRVHKSFIVATNKIKHIEGNIIVLNENKIPIGQTYKASIQKLYLQ